MRRDHKIMEEHLWEVEEEYSNLQHSYADLSNKYNALVEKTNSDREAIVQVMVDTGLNAARIIEETDEFIKGSSRGMIANQVEYLSTMITLATEYEKLKPHDPANSELPERNSYKEGPERNKQHYKIAKRTTHVFALGAIVFVLIMNIFLAGNLNEKGKLFGYSWFAVVSESMQSEIPQGALVFVKKVDPDQIEVGDNIAFLRSKDEAAITHKVVEIYEKYGESGNRGFKTWGIENRDPDPDIVRADYVIGVVKFTAPGVGAFISNAFLSIGLLLVVTGAAIIIFFLSGKRSRIKGGKQL